ncbi:hypothetical protein [Pseudoalteromonas sp. S16_S37]|uniref:hypothetical protein n=1 Tax=Pseudoalteromonas sp. S16_S37 TaxID=2720228 RepID=UPI001680DF2C|nr:hypothetical protein [Pseudoalteromonas sp. S16_S37]MBD1582427.1 hypothetical protein [Pseudoalteromonas sp. S16_S37]
MTEGSGISSSHTIHIATFAKGFVKSFSVTSRPELGQGGELETVVVARLAITPAHIQESVNSGYAILNRYAFGVPIQVPDSSGFNTAWDLARNYSNHDRFDDWFLDAHPITYTLSQFTSIVGGMFVGGLNGLEVKFVFPDGTSLIMIASSTGSNSLRFSYKERSSRDANGNLIPASGKTVSGDYSFTTDQGLQDFINILAQHGIQVTVIHGSGWMGEGRGGTVTIVPFSPR